jgi:hypothetical protein
VPRSRKRRSGVCEVVTQSEAKGTLVCVAVAVVIVAGLRREAGTTRPTNVFGSESAGHVTARGTASTYHCVCWWFEGNARGLWLLLCSKIVVNVR